MSQDIRRIQIEQGVYVWAEKVVYDDGQWGTATIAGESYAVCWSYDGDGYSQMGDPDITRYEANEQQQVVNLQQKSSKDEMLEKGIITLQPVQVRRSELDTLIAAGVNFYGSDTALRAVLPQGSREEEGTHSTYILPNRTVVRVEADRYLIIVE